MHTVCVWGGGGGGGGQAMIVQGSCTHAAPLRTIISNDVATSCNILRASSDEIEGFFCSQMGKFARKKEIVMLGFGIRKPESRSCRIVVLRLSAQCCT